MNAPRRKKNSPKVNLVVSGIFHAVVIGVLVFVAAREGMFGKELKKIAVTLAPKEKPPEKPKEIKPEPKPETPVQAQTKPAEAPKLAAQPPPAATPSGAVAPPSGAPPPVALAAFDFAGGKAVESISDPVALYKGFVEFILRSRWMRPENVADDSYVAEVELHIDSSGRIVQTTWQRGSGDARWDASVKQAVAQSMAIGRPPPKGFPDHFAVRFDVQSDAMSDATASIQ
jgi:type IV secretory pathway VirB10-like protein